MTSFLMTAVMAAFAGLQVADRVRHGRQRPGIDGVGLGAASPRAREAPDLVSSKVIVIRDCTIFVSCRLTGPCWTVPRKRENRT